MTKDKRIEWCRKHCIDDDGNSYIDNLHFSDSEFIEIDLNHYNWLHLCFDGEKLPDFIKFKVKVNKSYHPQVDIDIEKCSHLKSWQGLPTDNISFVYFGNELENIDSMPICKFIDHIFIKDKQERHRANKKLRIKQWENFQSEVLKKIQEQNHKINISDYKSVIKWLAIHDISFYNKYLTKNLFFNNDKTILNKFAILESVTNAPLIKIQVNSDLSSSIYIDEYFNYFDSEKLMNNIFSEKKIDIYLPNQETCIIKEDFLKLTEEKINHNIIESKKSIHKHCKNK